LNPLLFFSHNQKKILEVNKVFEKSILKIYNLNNLKTIIEPKEKGNSFADNAKIKSLFGFKTFGVPCFADDSGICISALSNKPGIQSKRFLTKFKNNNEAFNHIISTAIKKNDFKAYFNTTICLTLATNQHIFFVGKIRGEISKNPRGSNGFGYDPIFTPNGHEKTFGEMGFSKKNRISHRMIALQKMESFLIN